MVKRISIRTHDNCFTVRYLDFSKDNVFHWNLKDFFVISIYKYSNHNYTLKFFNYRTSYIYSRDNFFTLKSLYNTLDSLIQDFL